MNHIDTILNMPTTKHDFDLILAICKRARDLELIDQNSFMSILMDIENTHKICPLDLHALLNYFNDQSFAHDICGISYNFNRVTYTLDNYFLPRCAMPRYITEADLLG